MSALTRKDLVVGNYLSCTKAEYPQYFAVGEAYPITKIIPSEDPDNAYVFLRDEEGNEHEWDEEALCLENGHEDWDTQFILVKPTIH